MSARILVAAGLIESSTGGEYLLTRRLADAHLAGAWEFPGGKIEPGEAPEAALRRELREELAIEVEVGDVFAVGHHAYPPPGKEVVLLVYRCRHVAGQPTCLGVAAFEWMPAERLIALAMPPADEPVLARLRRERGQ